MDENIQKYLIELIEIIDSLNSQVPDDRDWHNRDLALRNLKEKVEREET